MKGKLIVSAAGVAALAAAVLVVGALVTGRQTQKDLVALPRAWQAQWPTLAVVDQTYDKRLFSATHVVTIQVGCEPLLLTFRQHIQHGPLPGMRAVGTAVIDTEWVLPETQRQRFSELAEGQAPLTAHTVLALNGAQHTRLAMPPLQWRGPQGERLIWRGLQARLDRKGTALAVDVTLPGARLSLNDQKTAIDVRFDGARLRGDVNGSGVLWLRPGEAEGEMATLALWMMGLATPARPATTLSFSDLRLRTSNTLAQGLLSTTGRLAGRGLVGEAKLDKIEAQVSLKRIDAASVERLMQHAMDAAIGCDAGPTAEDASPAPLITPVEQDLRALLPFDPEYSLDTLALEIDGQGGNVSFAVGTSGVSEAELTLPLPALVMSRGRLRGQARLPQDWVKLLMARFGGVQGDASTRDEWLDILAAQMTRNGFLVREGDMLSTEFSFDKGQLLVNGLPLNVKKP